MECKYSLVLLIAEFFGTIHSCKDQLVSLRGSSTIRGNKGTQLCYHGRCYALGGYMQKSGDADARISDFIFLLLSTMRSLMHHPVCYFGSTTDSQ